MSNRRSLKPKEVEKILLGKGFLTKRQTGSHRIYHNVLTKATVVVPFHSKDLPLGTLHSIIQQSKLETDDFK